MVPAWAAYYLGEIIRSPIRHGSKVVAVMFFFYFKVVDEVEKQGSVNLSLLLNFL